MIIRKFLANKFGNWCISLFREGFYGWLVFWFFQLAIEAIVWEGRDGLGLWLWAMLVPELIGILHSYLEPNSKSLQKR